MEELVKKPIAAAKKLQIVQKKLWFDGILRKQRKTGGETIDLLIRREHLFEDSFNQFFTTTDLDFKREVRINFADEPAQDIGGVMRDWFSTLMKEIFKEERKFFTLDTQGQYRISAESIEIEGYEQQFQFIGNLLGKALF